MSKIKSMEELQKIRNKVVEQVQLRKTGENKDRIILAVGMATCGIAAGARATLSALLDEISIYKLDQIAVVQTGCLGYCYAEPIVEVRIPGQEPILYGEVDEQRARDIIRIHILQGALLENAIIGKGFEKI